MNTAIPGPVWRPDGCSPCGFGRGPRRPQTWEGVSPWLPAGSRGQDGREAWRQDGPGTSCSMCRLPVMEVSQGRLLLLGQLRPQCPPPTHECGEQLGRESEQKS